MPIYEYRCATCGTDFEKLVKMSAPTPPCPECGATDSKKKVSAGAFVLKGSGWYKDHYGLKSSSSSGSSGSDSSSSSDSSSGSDSSSSSASTSSSSAPAKSGASSSTPSSGD